MLKLTSPNCLVSRLKHPNSPHLTHPTHFRHSKAHSPNSNIPKFTSHPTIFRHYKAHSPNSKFLKLTSPNCLVSRLNHPSLASLALLEHKVNFLDEFQSVKWHMKKVLRSSFSPPKMEGLHFETFHCVCQVEKGWVWHVFSLGKM